MMGLIGISIACAIIFLAVLYLFSLPVAEKTGTSEKIKVAERSLVYTNIFETVEEASSEASVSQFKADLMIFIRDVLDQKRYELSEIESNFDFSKSDFEKIEAGQIDRFSIDELIEILARLGYQLRHSNYN